MATGCQHRTETITAIVIAIACGCGAWSLFGTHIIGHDEGIYAMTAASLRRTGEYRLTNLPSQPFQTKYPPFYPVVLASALSADVPVAGQVIRLKTANAVFFAATLLLSASLLRRCGVSGWWRWASTLLLLALSPGMLSSTNWLMAEQLFTTLLVAVLAVAPEAPPVRMWRIVAAALLAALAALTRSVGVAACIALVWYFGRRLGRGPAVVAALVILTVVGPWFVWAGISHDPNLNPLEHYYVVYERSAWSRLAENPPFALRILAVNALGLASVSPTVVGFYTPVTCMLGGGFICAGLMRFRRFPLSELLVSTTVIYLLIVIGHPMNMDRYLVPLIPAAILMLGLGAAVATTGTSLAARTWRLPVELAVLALLTGSLMWAQHYAQVSRDGKNAGIGQVQPFAWKGFQEVIEWLLANTPPGAVIGSGYDTTYATYTGRRGLRPWLHAPEAYDPRYGRYSQWPSDPVATAELVERANVSYLIVDPYPAGGPGAHAQNMLQALVGQRPPRWELCFTSSDGHHLVYRRIDRHRAPSR